MGKASEVVVNLGSSHVSAGRFLIGDTLILQKAFFQELPVAKTEEKDWLEALSSALSDLSADKGWAGDARFILPGSFVLSKTLRIPKVEPEKKTKIVSYELSQKMPFPLESLVWDYSVIDDDGIEEEILAFAIKPDIVENLCQLLFRNGFTPLQLIPSPVADQVAFDQSSADEEQEKLYLNLGAKSINLTFRNPTGSLVRSINFGGHALTESISEKFAISSTKAEELKLDYNSGKLKLPEGDPGLVALETATQNFLNRLIQDVSRAIVTYKRVKKGKYPLSIHVTGRGLKTSGFINYLAGCQPAPIRYFDPFRIIELDESIEDEEKIELPYFFSEPIGVACSLRESSAGTGMINLLPRKKMLELERRKKLPWLLLASVLMALLPLPWIFSLMGESRLVSAQIKTTKSEVSLAQKNLQDLQENKEKLSNLQRINRHSAEYLLAWERTSRRAFAQQSLLNSLQVAVDDPKNKNTWIDEISFYAETGTNHSLAQEEEVSGKRQFVRISGRYLVALEGAAKEGDSDRRNLLIDSNGIKQESLTESFAALPQVLRVLNKVFSTEGKGDLYNRQFTHFEFDLEVDLAR